MKTTYKIAIPKPCHEDWDTMAPNGNGRFCDSCTKNVVDFTHLTPGKIQDYFAQHKEERICGRFKNMQLDTLTIQIPTTLLFSQTQYHKMFLLALFVSMGTTLFSCSDKDGNMQKIDKVEVVADTTLNTENTDEVLIGMIDYSRYDSLDPRLPPPPKVDQVKFVRTPIEKGK